MGRIRAYSFSMDDASPPDRPPDLRVIVSLDVEEEGLFTGSYPATDCGVKNVVLLRRLAPLSLELGFPLTLFCAHSVFCDATACATLEFMRDRCGAEIAAHLHHWSTPPLDAPAPSGPPERTDRLPPDTLRRKLDALLKAGEHFQSAPLTSFRMGRWDLKSNLHPLLAAMGIRVDSSVCPLRAFRGGPDHFLAPADPYWTGASPPLLELPLTQIPLIPSLAGFWHRLNRRFPGILDTFHYWNAASANPVWHGQGIMRHAVKEHVRRGGKVLTLFWHSSEMMPGGSPHVPDQAAADALLRKTGDFLSWLGSNYNVQGITAAGLLSIAPQLHFPVRPEGPGDW